MNGSYRCSANRPCPCISARRELPTNNRHLPRMRQEGQHAPAGTQTRQVQTVLQTAFKTHDRRDAEILGEEVGTTARCRGFSGRPAGDSNPLAGLLEVRITKMEARG